MAYTRAYATWKDYPDTSTPITAAKMQVVEDGISGLAAGTTPFDGLLLSAGSIARLIEAIRESDFTARNFARVQIASGAGATTIANLGTGYYTGLALVHYMSNTDTSNHGVVLLLLRMDFSTNTVTTVSAIAYGGSGGTPTFSGSGTGTNAKLLQATPGAAGFTGNYYAVFLGFGL